MAAVRHMGAAQNARSLWFNLDVDQSGTLSLYDLDPLAAHALDRFRYLCTSRYGSMAKAFKGLLDVNGSGVLEMEEFLVAMATVGYEAAEARELFGFLQPRPGAMVLKPVDLEFLQCWEVGSGLLRGHPSLQCLIYIWSRPPAGYPPPPPPHGMVQVGVQGQGRGMPLQPNH